MGITNDLDVPVLTVTVGYEIRHKILLSFWLVLNYSSRVVVSIALM